MPRSRSSADESAGLLRRDVVGSTPAGTSDPEVDGARPTLWLSHEQAMLADRVTPLDRLGYFFVSSASRPNLWHTVHMDEHTGVTDCNCEAAEYGRHCHHRRAVHLYLSRLVGKPL